ncbi:MAG: cysteine desulfurase [Cytophagales bacterium]|nr:cysteine desulfurase [Cytophagales bacterium]
MTQVAALDVSTIRKEFPILNQEVNGYPLVYFDNAASSQKPKSVIQALVDYYSKDHSNIHRGLHTLAERATSGYEQVRKMAQTFVNADEPEEIIFTRGTTESINLVAQAYGRKVLEEGDEIILSEMEHHSNIVPWQMVAEEKGAIIKVIPVSNFGELILEEYENLLSEKTKIVALNYISNSLGTINSVQEIIEKAHHAGAKILIDAAQAAPHLKIDVQELEADFLALSSHKMYGPTGVGILYGKRELLEYMDPYQGGGEMIKEVHFSGTTYNDIPYKFEAGTPNIADVIAFGAAIDFVERIGHDTIQTHEKELLEKAMEGLNQIEGFEPVGVAKNKASVISFNINGIHSYDLGMWLDARGIAVRTGHHCTQPLMDRMGLEGTIRASFAVYNSPEEIDSFVDSLSQIIKKFGK